MKKIIFVTAAILLFSLQHSTTQTTPAPAVKADPFTVLVTFHVIPGKEEEFKSILSRAWEAYRKENLVFTEPHTLVQGTGEDKKPVFVEIFTWKSRAALRASTNIWQLWPEVHTFCEARDGDAAILSREVTLLVPSQK